MSNNIARLSEWIIKKRIFFMKSWFPPWLRKEMLSNIWSKSGPVCSLLTLAGFCALCIDGHVWRWVNLNKFWRFSPNYYKPLNGWMLIWSTTKPQRQLGGSRQSLLPALRVYWCGCSPDLLAALEYLWWGSVEHGRSRMSLMGMFMGRDCWRKSHSCVSWCRWQV